MWQQEGASTHTATFAGKRGIYVSRVRQHGCVLPSSHWWATAATARRIDGDCRPTLPSLNSSTSSLQVFKLGWWDMACGRSGPPCGLHTISAKAMVAAAPTPGCSEYSAKLLNKSSSGALTCSVADCMALETRAPCYLCLSCVQQPHSLHAVAPRPRPWLSPFTQVRTAPAARRATPAGPLPCPVTTWRS